MVFVSVMGISVGSSATGNPQLLSKHGRVCMWDTGFLVDGEDSQDSHMGSHYSLLETGMGVQ